MINNMQDKTVLKKVIKDHLPQAKNIYGFLLYASLVPALAYAGDDEVRTVHIKGIPVTGANDVCGVPQWEIPPPLPIDAHFTLIGAHNDAGNAINSIALNEELCATDSTLLATYSNPQLNALGGFPDADNRIKNIPLRDVQVKASVDGTRMSLPSMDQSTGNPFPPTKNYSNDPITVGDWFKASGDMVIHCEKDGSATVKARFINLIPDSVYSLVATWLTVLPGGSFPTFASVAFGGVPNIVTPDKHGKASFQRELNYCPMDTSPDGSVIMFASLGYHADGTPPGVFQQNVAEINTFTSADGTVIKSVAPPGILTLPHVHFPITIKPLTK